LEKDVIVIRRAEAQDVEFIWQILHAEGKQWNINEININLPHLFVLAYGTKIIGVLYGLMNPMDKLKVFWIITHPMFPENPVQILMYQALSEIYIRRANF
jgi:hypothetical protein